MGNGILFRDQGIKRIYDSIEDSVDSYFNNLFGGDSVISYLNDNTKEVIEIVKNYREGQHNYALDIMYAIRNKKIILIQAGVGLGKSYGYLIPIFNTFIGTNNRKEIKFNKVIISTSNIALQYQLIRDIDIISKELDFKIEAVIAKGINNYACVKRMEKLINSRYTFPDRLEELKRILSKIEEIGSCDKASLGDIEKNVWKSIQLKNRGYCSKCSYGKNCSFYLTEQKIKTSNIIITNHANYITNVIKSENNVRDEELFSKDVDMVVIDEAHKFEENLINVLENEIRLSSVFNNLENLYRFVLDNIYREDMVSDEYSSYINSVKEKFRYLFAYIKRSASLVFARSNKNNNSITDGNRLSFNFSKEIIYLVNGVNKELKYIIGLLESTDSSSYRDEEKRCYLVNYFKKISEVMDDMALGNNRKNIYWVSFFETDSINLGYVVKDRSVVTDKIFDKRIPIVMTSATMLDYNNSYSYFRSRIGLDKLGRSVEEADEQKSPFDYDNNALFYYDTSIAVPNDKDNNICDLALKIGELIRATKGKALVLFTSKARMREVYDLVMEEDYPFPILIQNDISTDKIREEFEENVDACLFATGSFWEGISIKGKSLSNLIITHLPFDNVDAINKYEAGKYASNEEKMKNVYIPDMLIKMKQAIGRLIRTSTDTGIVSCLDSRIVSYLDSIKKCSPIKNFTSDMNVVYDFVDKKILDPKDCDSKIKKL